MASRSRLYTKIYFDRYIADILETIRKHFRKTFVVHKRRAKNYLCTTRRILQKKEGKKKNRPSRYGKISKLSAKKERERQKSMQKIQIDRLLSNVPNC